MFALAVRSGTLLILSALLPSACGMPQVAGGLSDPAATPAQAPSASASELRVPDPANVCQATVAGLAPQGADVTPRVYVPNEKSNA